MTRSTDLSVYLCLSYPIFLYNSKQNTLFLPPLYNVNQLLVEVSKLSELNASAGGYDWVWQQNARALQEKQEEARGIEPEDDGIRDIKASLNLSMDNTLMVRKAVLFRPPCCKGR